MTEHIIKYLKDQGGFCTRTRLWSRRWYLFKDRFEFTEALSAMVAESLIGEKLIGRMRYYFVPDAAGDNLKRLEALEEAAGGYSPPPPTLIEQLDKLLGGTNHDQSAREAPAKEAEGPSGDDPERGPSDQGEKAGGGQGEEL